MYPLLIQYDLRFGGSDDYADLIEFLSDLGAVCATESSWFLASPVQATVIKEHLEDYLDEDDVVTVNVLAVGRGYSSQNLSLKARAWVAKYLSPAKARATR